MTEWREVKLGDICTSIQYGYTESATFDPVGPKFLRITDIVPNFINWSTVPYCKIDKENYEKYKLDVGDIVIARTGATTGYNKRIKDSINAVFASYLIRFKINKEIADDCFISYVLKSDSYFGFIDNAIGGSAQPGINARVLSQFSFLLPPLPEQKAIAEVLSSLDDKIDLLTRQNKTLEDLAQAYFRKWFIEDASDEWEVGKLGDEFNITMGQSPKGETYNDLKIGLPFFQGKAEFGFRFPLEKQYCSEPVKIADKFDTLLSVRAPVGALNMAMYRCCIGRGLAIPIHKKGYKHYTFYKMKSLREVFDTFDDDGTVFGSISREKFLSIENVIPPEKLVCSFDNFARHFDLKIYENTVQIRTLTKLRDTLLPKLISGEIRVKM